MRPYFTFLLLQILIISVSCNNDDNLNANGGGCVFEQNDENMDGLLDEFEESIIDITRANAFTSKTEIENNLIGEWELIGHVEGWTPKISQPCAYITITTDELLFEYQNAHRDTVTNHPWEIEEFNTPSTQIFSLKVVPERVEGLNINEFSPNYMFGNLNVIDGNIYIYQKVR